MALPQTCASIRATRYAPRATRHALRTTHHALRPAHAGTAAEEAAAGRRSARCRWGCRPSTQTRWAAARQSWDPWGARTARRWRSETPTREREPRRTRATRRARMAACTTGGLRPLTPLGTPPGGAGLPLALPWHSRFARARRGAALNTLLPRLYGFTLETACMCHACTVHIAGSVRRAPASHASTRARNVANSCRQRLTKAHQWTNCRANCRIPGLAGCGGGASIL